MRWFGKRNKGDQQQQSGKPPSGSAEPTAAKLSPQLAAKDRVIRVFVSSTFRDMQARSRFHVGRFTGCRCKAGSKLQVGKFRVHRLQVTGCRFELVNMLPANLKPANLTPAGLAFAHQNDYHSPYE
jgi:hypothetical protein